MLARLPWGGGEGAEWRDHSSTAQKIDFGGACFPLEKCFSIFTPRPLYLAHRQIMLEATSKTTTNNHITNPQQVTRTIFHAESNGAVGVPRSSAPTDVLTATAATAIFLQST